LQPEVKQKRVIEFKISVGYHGKFSIWRKVLVSENIKFTKLARILLTTMGWTGYQKFEFNIKGDTLHIEDNSKLLQKKYRRLANEVTLDYYKLQKSEGFKLIYDVEKEQNWSHDVIVEDIHIIGENLPANSDKLKALSHGVCLSGGGCCPPDDIGTPQNYAYVIDLLKAKSPRDSYAKYMEFLGEDYNPDECDKNAINNKLKMYAYDEKGLKDDEADSDLFKW